MQRQVKYGGIRPTGQRKIHVLWPSREVSDRVQKAHILLWSAWSWKRESSAHVIGPCPVRVNAYASPTPEWSCFLIRENAFNKTQSFRLEAFIGLTVFVRASDHAQHHSLELELSENSAISSESSQQLPNPIYKNY